MTTTHHAGPREIRPAVARREPPRSRPRRTIEWSTGPALAAAAAGTHVTFVFRDGRTLSPTEVANLRVFAAAGILSQRVNRGV